MEVTHAGYSNAVPLQYVARRPLSKLTGATYPGDD